MFTSIGLPGLLGISFIVLLLLARARLGLVTARGAAHATTPGRAVHPRSKGLLFGGALAIASMALAGQALAQSAPQPGLYTSEQAMRGEKVFLGNCVGCHGYSMSSIFSGYRNAYIYWGKISSTMPWEDAGHLAPQDYIDIVAYMMRENGFAPGDDELKMERAVMESIIPPRAGMK